ncbi:hypothetical protein VIBHAR_06995 [Vibrio campbellii ATCC BAA-1116]|uniref:Uncharacterized protein n=1 Tax=Vibrio campbellii (strain ATCC BAA-1116) TaxID=2902295 RepID=A7N5X1_VIBC1|nr:hypothetical protein VIBHAR_06995 [Vibrio campbellii ATCC BAA-1116]
MIFIHKSIFLGFKTVLTASTQPKRMLSAKHQPNSDKSINKMS